MAAPNRVWLPDITCIPTAEGWLYLAVVLDMFSRRVVGWAMRETMPQELTMAALQMALSNRRPGSGLVHHSDRGSQGELNRLSQHLEGGSCDDQSNATFGAIRAAAIVVTGSTARSRTRAAAMVLGRDRVVRRK